MVAPQLKRINGSLTPHMNSRKCMERSGTPGNNSEAHVLKGGAGRVVAFVCFHFVDYFSSFGCLRFDILNEISLEFSI